MQSKTTPNVNKRATIQFDEEAEERLKPTKNKFPKMQIYNDGGSIWSFLSCVISFVIIGLIVIVSMIY